MSLALASIFASGMILQRELPARVWGTAEPDASVEVCIQGQVATTVADAQGSWSCTLEPLRASDAEKLEVRAGNERIVLSDVAVGEVFIAAGQSNMEFWMRYDHDVEEFRPTCTNAHIRFYDQPECSYPGQAEDLDYSEAGIWRKATPEDLDYFSAVGYYFARGMEMVLDMPVGIVGCNCGGSKSSAWMMSDNDVPGALFTHMVLPIAGFATRGVLWYQGESDDEKDGAQARYAEALRTIIADWREAWQRVDLPFFVVQLPGFGSCASMGIDAHDWPSIRADQQQVADEDERVWLCSIGDLGDKRDIHPKEKKPVGERLSLLAMRHLLGMDVPADAPRCVGAERKGPWVILHFEYVAGGLVLAGAEVNALELLRDGVPMSFCAGTRGDRLVIVPEEPTTEPLEVRFAQANWYRINLYNGAGIPALPFALTC